MKNEWIGFLLFCLLMLGGGIGLYFDRLQIFGVLGFALGLGLILLFRKK